VVARAKVEKDGAGYLPVEVSQGAVRMFISPVSSSAVKTPVLKNWTYARIA